MSGSRTTRGRTYPGPGPVPRGTVRGMGFMDRVKSIKNSLTGDWADLTVHVDGPVRRGGAAKATVEVTVKDSPISIDGIILEVRCEEKIDIPDATVSSSSNSEKVRATSNETVVDDEVKVAGAQDLAGGSTSTFSGEIPISDSAPVSMVGRHARYVWQIRARLDMKGNDPDSGWETLEVT